MTPWLIGVGGGFLVFLLAIFVPKRHCPNCKEPTRVRHSVLEDGRRVRVCSHCDKAIEVTA